MVWQMFDSHEIFTKWNVNQEWCAIHKQYIWHESYKLTSLKKSPRYINIIYRHPIRILEHCLAPGIKKVCIKHGVSLSNVRSSNRSVLYHVVSCHGFEVSLRWMYNYSLAFSSKFFCGNIFLGEPFKLSQKVCTKSMSWDFLALV